MASLQNVLETANKKFGQGEYAEAYAEYLTALLEISPEDKENCAAIHTNAGACLLNMTRVDEALAEYQTALELDPANLNAHHNKGVALRKLDRIDEAKECFKAVTSQDDSFVASFRGLVDCSMTTHAFDEALDFCEQALSIVGEDASLLTDKANVLLKLGRAEEALPEYEKVVAQGAGSAQVQQLYAIALSQVAVAADKAGDMERAEGLYSKAIDIEATSTRLFNRAFLYMRTSRLQEALDGFAAVVTADPGNIKAHAALGTLLLQQQHYEKAVESLRKASEGSSGEEYADVTYNLGFALLKLEQYQAAQQAFQSVLEIDADNENAKNGLKAAMVHTARASSEQPEPALSEKPVVAVEQPPQPASPAASAAAPQERAETTAAAAASANNAEGGSYFAIADLLQKPFPEGVDSTKREEYLTEEDFQAAFDMDRASFVKLPKWKRVSLKKQAGLF